MVRNTEHKAPRRTRFGRGVLGVLVLRSSTALGRREWLSENKGKDFPVQDLTDPEGCKRLRFLGFSVDT